MILMKISFLQRFVKENGLIGNLIRYMKESIDGCTVIIYEKYVLIIHIKDSEN
jgi:hypothetical protein